MSRIDEETAERIGAPTGVARGESRLLRRLLAAHLVSPLRANRHVRRVELAREGDGWHLYVLVDSPSFEVHREVTEALLGVHDALQRELPDLLIDHHVWLERHTPQAAGRVSIYRASEAAQ